MCSIYKTNEQVSKHLLIKRGPKELLGGDEYIYGLDGGDSFRGICLSLNSSNYTLNMYSLLYDNHTSIEWLKKTIATYQDLDHNRA